MTKNLSLIVIDHTYAHRHEQYILIIAMVVVEEYYYYNKLDVCVYVVQL